MKEGPAQITISRCPHEDESLISRASARTLLSTIDGADEALLDFNGVKSIGPAFADEIFRVFSNSFPKVRLIAINANEQVTGMIRRALAAKEGPTLFD